MDQLNIHLFGSMQLTRGEIGLTNFGSNKVRALFVYLILEANHAHQRRKLASLLWPELPETSALSNLRYALSNLTDFTGRVGYLNPIGTADGLRFVAKGPFMKDFKGRTFYRLMVTVSPTSARHHHTQPLPTECRQG